MDTGTPPVVIQIQLVLLSEESSFHLPIQADIPQQASSLIADFLSGLQTPNKNQAGEILLSSLREKLKSPFSHSHLTCREQEVLELLRKGNSHKQIAAELHIATRTVGKHLQNIYEKLGVSCKYEVFQKLAQQT